MPARLKSAKGSASKRAPTSALKRALDERDEALRFQAATADILASLSGSRESPQPVFDAIVNNVRRLFDARYAVVFLLKGDQLDLAAVSGDAKFDGPRSEAGKRFRASFPQAIDPDSFTGKALRARRAMQLSPIIGNPEASPRAEALAKAFGYDSIVIAPLVREGQVIGAIGTNHPKARRYSEKELALFRAFADQAVVAIENARLFKETNEALERQKASAEILRVIARSPGEIQPVLDAMAETAARLCGANDVVIRRLDGDLLHVAAHFGSLPITVDAHACTRQTVAGRAVLERRTMHVEDIRSPEGRAEFPDAPAVRRPVDFHTILAVPLVRDAAGIGVILLRRLEARLFSEQQVKLLESFADQAVIAMENARLFNETHEALERQTATAEVLTVIAGSPSDVQPVFDAIVESAMRLLKGATAHMTRLDGGILHLAAYSKTDAAGAAALQRLYPLAVAGTVAEQVLEARAPLVVADAEADARLSDAVRAAMRARGVRSFVLVPLVSRGRSIGTIVVNRRTAERFSDHETRLLQTFADQAVIAIENARLFSETKEALEQQTATAEILSAISATPTDTQPVFEVIARSALRIFGGMDVGVGVVDGDEIEIRASTLRHADKGVARRVPLNRDTALGRAILDRTAMNIGDIESPDTPPLTRERGRATGWRSVAEAPMLREGAAIGFISVHRAQPGPLSEKQMALLKTFADQAVIAIENVRLFNETKEALERQTATAEVLRVISGSPTDVQPVFDAILESATKLCEAQTGILFRYEEDEYHALAIRIPDAFKNAALFRKPIRPAPDSMTGLGRIRRELRPVHIPDMMNDPAYDARDPVRLESLQAGLRSWLGVPMLKDGMLVGTIVVYRGEPRPFTEAQIALLQTFADQAVIAIQNVRLFNETREALEQQTAISEVLRVISSSPSDVRPVLQAVAERAARICDAKDARLFVVEGDKLRFMEQVGDVPGAFADGETRPIDRGYVAGRCVFDKAVLHIEDIEAMADEFPTGHALSRAYGIRTFLAVPLMREQRVLGAILLRRSEVRPFSDKQIDLLKTFADQAAIAIENVRLFNETNEALERQTATSEILKVISSSTTDTQPVFEAIVRSAARLFPMSNATMFMRDGDLMRMHAVEGATVDDAVRRELASIYPIAFNPEVSTSARAMVERQINICLDTEAPDVPEHIRRAGRAGRFRSNTVVPLVRDDEGIGTIVITHPQPGHRLNEKQLALLRTFADQAVIAIENTRLFNELEARNKDLAESLEQQTATSEVLKVISRTQFDLEPVLNIVMDNALNLCAADRVVILRPNAQGHYVPAASRTRVDAPKGFLDVLRANPIRPDSSSATGRAITERAVIHIPDVLNDPAYGLRDIARAGTYRTLLAVPMLREGEPIGVLALSRAGEPKPFTDKQVALVTTFADQAVIAIENVRLFNEIQEKTRELEVANRHKSEFLANMSHELRTPLNAIIGFSEVLMEKMFGEVNEKQLDYLKDIHESGRHLLSLINDILDLSKIEAGRMELDLSRFHLPAAIGNAMTLVRERAQRHGIQLSHEIDPRLGEVEADERKVKQMLLNLLSNAVKFTPDGGRVDVTAKLDTDKVEIAVRDTGVGIAPQDQAALFEEFRQVGRDGARKAEGTGLGLALTKKFAELHGGTIRVESAPGAGATFTVSLPLR